MKMGKGKVPVWNKQPPRWTEGEEGRKSGSKVPLSLRKSKRRKKK